MPCMCVQQNKRNPCHVYNMHHMYNTRREFSMCPSFCPQQ